jgi:hypothetical protein
MSFLLICKLKIEFMSLRTSIYLLSCFHMFHHFTHERGIIIVNKVENAPIQKKFKIEMLPKIQFVTDYKELNGNKQQEKLRRKHYK